MKRSALFIVSCLLPALCLATFDLEDPAEPGKEIIEPKEGKSFFGRKDSKDKVMNAIFEGKIDELTLKFLMLVGEKGRDAMLPEIVTSFIEQVKLHKHIMVAKVISATPIDEATRAMIREIILKVHNGELELVEEINKDILGGFILNIADKRIDASIKGQLRELRTEFEHNPYEPQI